MYHIPMLEPLIKDLVRLAQRLAEGERIDPAEAQTLVHRLPVCHAPGCGVVLYRRRVYCSTTCRDHAPRDLPHAAIRRAARNPLPTYVLEDR